MADITGNPNPIRFELGGVLTVTKGSDKFIMACVEPGTIEYEDGGFALVHWHDRDTGQIPLRGEQLLGRIRFRGKFTGPNDNTDLRKFLTQVPVSGNRHQTYAVEVQYPASTGVVAASEVSVADAFLTKPPSVQAADGQNADTIDVEFNYYGYATVGALS